MPLFSIIVPVYNTAPFLSRCLDSILAQTEGDFEVIVIDDGSTDTSLSIAETYAKFDARFVVLHQENAGLSEARNRAIEKATGAYLAFVDSDDFITPDFCAVLKQTIEEQQSDLIVFDFDYVFDTGKVIPSATVRHTSPTLDRALLISAPMAPVRCVRRDLVAGRAFPAGKLYEDLATTPLWLLASTRPIYLKQTLYHYYQRTGSIMHTRAFSKRFLDIYQALDRVFCAYATAGKEKEFAPELEYLFIEHLLRSAALRFVVSDGGKAEFYRLAGAVREKFPAFSENPYLKQSSRAFRLVVFLSTHKAYHTLRFLGKRRKS